ncbi:hypothetical protein WMF37_34420 [Sorangium sp. So ce291]|uniref:hypothetical protein n=1 Tax=Sorangium sp. So ce291 TaxID=3133294 RepID=UPI003F61A53B
MSAIHLGAWAPTYTQMDEQKRSVCHGDQRKLKANWRDVSKPPHVGPFAFVYNEDNTPMTTARIELVLDTVGQGCDEIAGSLVVRTFEDGEDPLDISSDTGDPIASDTFTGRRAKPSP